MEHLHKLPSLMDCKFSYSTFGCGSTCHFDAISYLKHFFSLFVRLHCCKSLLFMSFSASEALSCSIVCMLGLQLDGVQTVLDSHHMWGSLCQKFWRKIGINFSILSPFKFHLSWRSDLFPELTKMHDTPLWQWNCRHQWLSIVVCCPCWLLLHLAWRPNLKWFSFNQPNWASICQVELCSAVLTSDVLELRVLHSAATEGALSPAGSCYDG